MQLKGEGEAGMGMDFKVEQGHAAARWKKGELSMNSGREITSISAQSHCGKNFNLVILGGFILKDSSSKPPLTI